MSIFDDKNDDEIIWLVSWIVSVLFSSLLLYIALYQSEQVSDWRKLKVGLFTLLGISLISFVLWWRVIDREYPLLVWIAVIVGSWIVMLAQNDTIVITVFLYLSLLGAAKITDLAIEEVKKSVQAKDWVSSIEFLIMPLIWIAGLSCFIYSIFTLPALSLSILFLTILILIAVGFMIWLLSIKRWAETIVFGALTIFKSQEVGL